jgi:hypothetical protein
MRSRVIGFTILASWVALLGGVPLALSQVRGLTVGNVSWERAAVVGLPGDDDEGDDEGADCPPHPAPVARTGQTISYASGDDGEYQAGVSVDPRFTDNSDGTVTDNLTALIWLQDANCFGFQSWTNSLSDANGLASGACGLTDGSVGGDWRLPNLRELQSLIDVGQSRPAMPVGHPFSGVQADYYWSSSSYADLPDGAWVVILHFGNANVDNKANTRHVWPVRGPE